jgi:hypothetical protein
VDPFRDPFSKETLSPRHHAKDEERRLPPKGQTVGWRNESKDRLQKSQTIPHISQPLSLHDQMKTKSRDFCPKDKLLYGGMRVKTNREQATEKLDNIIQVSTSQSS